MDSIPARALRSSAVPLPRRLLAALLPGLLALALAPSAGAAVFGGQVVDGPSASLTSTGSLDLARDGTGGIAYVRDGRVDVATLSDGSWNAPVAVDTGVGAAASNVHLSAAPGGALLVAWIAGGRVWTAYRAPLDPSFHAPVAVYAGNVDSVSADLSVNLKGYVAFHGDGNVRVARLANGAWDLVPQPLDANPAADAGAGTGRPQVAVASDGTAIAVWGEAGSVYARRVRGDHVSTVVVPASLPSLFGRPAAGADQPVVGTGDDDSFAVVAFREILQGSGGGTFTRIIARRLHGSAFDDPAAVDGLGFSTTQSASRPDVAVAGNGHGIITFSRADNQVWAALADPPGKPGAASRFDTATSTADPEPVVGVAEHTWAYVAYRRATASSSEVVLRTQRTNGARELGAEHVVSSAALGGVDPSAGLQAAADDAGDVVVAFVQDSGAGGRLVVGGFDFPPSPPTNLGPAKWFRTSHPRLVWTASDEHWGVRYLVTIDGQTAGTAYVNRFRPTASYADGTHTYQVTAVDARGQSATSRPATIRIDTRKPRARLAVGGTYRVRGTVRARARGRDTGSGVHRLTISWGDHSKRVRVRSGHRVTHRYRHARRYKVTLAVRDEAGNVTRVVKRVRIRGASRH